MDEKAKEKFVTIVSIFTLFGAILLLIPYFQNILIRVITELKGDSLADPKVWIQRIYIISFSLIILTFYFIYYYNNNNNKFVEYGSIIFLFGSLLFFYIFKCTESSIWSDEGIEYWVSKNISGVTYDILKPNMYERICSTIQPPLYNFLMFLWLKILDTEFWFKFFGTICFIVGDIAFFILCREFFEIIPSCIITFIFGMGQNFIYYAQEAAEYTCLFCFICWMILFFYRSLQNYSCKNVILYFVFAVLSIYSQYGACFIILGTGIILFFRAFINKKDEVKKKNILLFLFCAFLCVVVFVLPLFFFFIRRQVLGYITSNDHSYNIFNRNIFLDYIVSFIDTGSWFFGRYLTVLLCFIFSISLVFTICSRKKSNFYIFYAILAATLFAWTSYYLAVRYNIYKIYYSEGFGNRWGMSFCSLLALFFLYSLEILFRQLDNKGMLTKTINLLFVICVLFLCITRLDNALLPHYKKCYVREAYEYLKNINQPNKCIFVEPINVSTFAFYMTHDKEADSINQICLLKSYSEEEFENNLMDKSFESIYILCQSEPTDQIINVLKKFGYYRSDEVNTDNWCFKNPAIIKFICRLK